MKLTERFQPAWAELQAWFSRLTNRERVMVLSGGGAAALFVLFVIFFSLASSASSIRHRTTTKLAKLQQVQLLAGSYNEADQARKEAERSLSANNVSLLSYIEEKGTAAGLEIPTMNPKADVPVGDEGKIIESSVEVTLTDVTLPKLIHFLEGVEQGPGMVKITYLRLEPRPSSELLTAWATVSTYHLKAGP